VRARPYLGPGQYAANSPAVLIGRFGHLQSIAARKMSPSRGQSQLRLGGSRLMHEQPWIFKCSPMGILVSRASSGVSWLLALAAPDQPAER
jgi:hypothetical protein